MVLSGSIACLKNTLQLNPMLLGGQTFRWKSIKDDNYIGVFGDAAWELSQTETHLNFTYHRKTIDKSVSVEATLKWYLRLDTEIKPLYDIWSQNDVHFRKASEKFYAVRMLRQELIENVFSFICSSNNNIKRITSMVEKLCQLYGDHIATINDTKYHSFPKVTSLSKSQVEGQLREAGFGYRAKFIYQTACKINDIGQDEWVSKMKQLDYNAAKRELMSLPGIGAKVADCICLMSLDHLEAIPVDTHVFQIAATHYLKHLKDKKTMTDKVYNEVGDYFRTLFGPLAGWAHTILFCYDLKEFQDHDGKRKNKSEPISKKKKQKQ